MNKPLKLAVAGLGTVGAELIRILHAKGNVLAERCGRAITVDSVCARDKQKERRVDLTGAHWFDDPVALAGSDIDVFVELMGGEDGPALQSVRTALSSGKHVVTANKALLAKHGVELARLAEENHVLLNYEAAVAGGIPVIKAMRESMTSNNINRVYGIMNGTCNYMLTRMEDEGLSFDECLADAQRLGYAEADPAFDIDGDDTAHKLAILASLSFGTEIAADEIYIEGITKITPEDIVAAKDLGYRIKLLGVAQMTDSGVESRVHPTMVPLSSPIAQVAGVINAVAIDGDIVGTLMMTGAGAGGSATASAVLADITDIAKSRPGYQHGPVFGKPAALLQPYKRAKMRQHEGGYFIRLSVYDRAGAMAAIATRMSEQDISLASIVQRRNKPRSAVVNKDEDAQTIILITHETHELQIREALSAISSDGYMAAEPQMIRIEEMV